MSEILWIAVPGGIEEDGGSRQALLRVLVVPRLDGVSLQAEGLQDWPSPELGGATLEVDFAATVEAPPHTVTGLAPRLQVQPGLWQTFFGSSTSLRPARSRGEAMPDVAVSETSGQARAIQDTFKTAARARVTLEQDGRAEYERAVREGLAVNWSGADLSAQAPETPPPPRVPEPPEFHRILGMLREHPRVLQALGLIFELHLPEAELPDGLSPGVVKVRWPGAPVSLPPVVSPWTQYETDGDRFLLASTDEISAGLVDLAASLDETGLVQARWQVVTVDVDGGAQRLREAARALLAEAEGTARSTTLPALRTAGLMLLRRGRQETFAARRRAAENNARRGSMDTAVLTADDLTLGYRLDVKEAGGEWVSLHARDAAYLVGGLDAGGGTAREEGQIKAHAAVRQGQGPLRADEVVARWSGWSLAVPRPALDGVPGRASRRPGLPFDFSWNFSVPKNTLPRLQFSRSYQLRMRVADLTGGGLSSGGTDDRCATGLIHYKRYEPVASPGLLLPEGTEAESLGSGVAVDLVVIRSEPGQSAAGFPASNPGYTVHPRRVLLPPLVPLDLAAQHPGTLDGDPAETFEKVQQAMGRLGGNGRGFSGQVSLPDPAADGLAAFPTRRPGEVAAGLALSRYAQLWPDLNAKELELGEPQPGVSPVGWQGERLMVRLAPGEQVTLELSTFLDGNSLDHFAAKEMLPEESENAALAGRHPLLTPARTVRLVHAVRRPINEPGGKLQPQRQPSETFVTLDPQPDGLQVDPKSTARLEIIAAWTEFDDDRMTTVEGAPVQAVTLERDDHALPEALRHEFGDTRHRRVSYTLTAVSRFRQFFHDDEDPERFLARTPLPTVSVPSSARPAPPTVLAVYPSFSWEQENLANPDFPGIFLRRRRMAGLRVELGRPWFLTGEGERLAVVTGPHADPLEAVRPFLSRAGRDPIWNTPAPAQWLTPQDFTTTAGSIENVMLDEAGAQVVAVPHEVWFQEGRWHADIALPGLAAASYNPFVRLAVARYQSESLAGLQLSPVTLTDMVPLLPARTLTVKTQFTLIGLLEATLEGLGPAGLLPNRVDVVVEHRPLPAGALDGPFELTALDGDQEELAGWTVTSSRSGRLGQAIQVELPPPGDGLVRIRVREVEQIGGQAAATAGTPAELSERVVFTDVFTGRF